MIYIFCLLAASCCLAQSAATARLGALVRNDLVVTNVDFSGISVSLAPATNYTDNATNTLATGPIYNLQQSVEGIGSRVSGLESYAATKDGLAAAALAATNYTDSAISNVMSTVKAGATDWYIPEKYDGVDIILVYTNLSVGTGWTPFPVDMRYNIGIPKGNLSSTNLVWTSGDAAQDIHASRILLRPTPEMEAYWNSKQDSLTFDSRPAPTSMNPVTSEGIYQSMASLELIIINSALDSTNYVNDSISTNNAAFVAAVTNCPVVIAAADGITLGDFGEYGTLGSLLAALAAAITWLKTNKANKTDLPYPFAEPTLSNGILTVSPRTVATYTAGTTAAAFTVAVGTGVAGAARDCVLVVDCTASGASAPSIVWPSNFHPRGGDAEEIAPVAGVRNVFYISEYAPGEFVVGGWHEEVA
jgi:hypothetical protein